METIYVSTRKELTEQLANNRANGATCYRIRTGCRCWAPTDENMYPRANQRNGILVINDDRVVAQYVKCRICNK